MSLYNILWTAYAVEDNEAIFKEAEEIAPNVAKVQLANLSESPGDAGKGANLFKVNTDTDQSR